MTMKRHLILLPCAALEVLRYMLLLMKLPQILGDSINSATPFLLRLLAAPNLLFPAMLVLLWLDEGRYASFKPLMLLGKAISFFAAILFLARLLGTRTGAQSADLKIILAILACMLVDMFIVIILITMRPAKETANPLQTGHSESAIETVVEN